MASPVAAALLNLLAGGTQGFAEARQRRTTERAAITERGKERRARRAEVETETNTREGIAAGEIAARKEQDAQRAREFGIEQKFKEGQAVKEDVYRSKILEYQASDLQAKTTIGQLEEKIAKLQTAGAGAEFDPYISIQKTVAEVYSKNATGDTPELAGQIAAKAATELHQIYQALGIIATPIGPPQGGDAGVNPPPTEEAKSNPVFGGGPAYATFPGVTIGGGKIAFGKNAKALADSLRSLSNAPR